MMQLFLSPVDVWLFRDGRPFDAHSDHRANSLFPPYPSVMQGVIRSHQLVVKKANLNDRDEIEKLVGTTERYGELKLRGPFIAKWEKKNDKWELTRYFPVPADVAVSDGMFKRLKHKSLDAKQFVTSAPIDQVLWSEHEPTKNSPGEWLTESELSECLKGNPVSATKTGDLFDRETRFGIKRDDAKRTTEEGALYEAEFIRPCKNVGLYLEVAGNGYDGWSESGVLRIGGEGRGARYENITAPKLPEPKKELRGQFKIYFATPTYFKNGWLPDKKDWSDFFDGDVQLVAAALNRYESIGGYDWAQNDHKSARRYVPAGSVYYFQVNGNGSAQLKTNAITDFGSEIGFGQIFIGGE